MKEHRLKFKNKELCDAVYTGRKPFEIRLNDRDYQVGDVIIPIAVDDDGQPVDHPINNVRYRITYVTDWEGVIAEGYCVFGIKRIRATGMLHPTWDNISRTSVR